MHFRTRSRTGEDVFQAPIPEGVPSLIDLGRLVAVTERILRDEETDEDFQLFFAPGSSLGGSHPKIPLKKIQTEKINRILLPAIIVGILRAGSRLHPRRPAFLVKSLRAPFHARR